MITTKNVTKHFGSFQALKDISFEISKGDIVGFLGQNGAGKTTLMRILTSYLPASSGTVMINGNDISKNSLEIRKNIGYLPETPPLYSNMTVKDYLRFAAELKDVPVKQCLRQLDKVLEECHIKDVKNKTIACLSKGYKQRVGIAQAIIHEPKLLILDEPTNGLDPIQIIQVRKLIKDLRNERTVLISTHILSEIEQIAHRVLIIKTGRIIVDESLDVLLNTKIAGQSQKPTLEEVFIRCHAKEPEACHE
jgi:ABC-2 type transport system ATP-binding protein